MSLWFQAASGFLSYSEKSQRLHNNLHVSVSSGLSLLFLAIFPSPHSALVTLPSELVLKHAGLLLSQGVCTWCSAQHALRWISTWLFSPPSVLRSNVTILVRPSLTIWFKLILLRPLGTRLLFSTSFLLSIRHQLTCYLFYLFICLPPLEWESHETRICIFYVHHSTRYLKTVPGAKC